MVLVSLGGEVEFAVGEVILSVASVETTNSIGGADSSLSETHISESTSLGVGAAHLEFEAIIVVLLENIDVHR